MDPMTFFDSAIERTTCALLERDMDASPESVAAQLCNNLFPLLIERAEIIQRETVQKLIGERVQ